MRIRLLNNELQKKAESELNEVPDRTEEDLEHIRQWVRKETHLTIRTDDQWLVAFLRGCKFSLQRSKETLDHFHTMRTLLPEFFTNRDPLLPEIQEAMKVGAILPLPKTTPNGARIVHFRFDGCDPDKVLVVAIMKLFLMYLDILMLEDDNCVVSGICIWADYTKFSLNYMMQFSPSFIKKSMLCFLAYPFRVKGSFCTNTPSVLETVFNLARTFMSEKLKTRMKLYSNANVDKFYTDGIPQNLLTKRYGGEIDCLDELTSEWKQKIESYRDWFLEDPKYCSNESLRRGKPRTSADVFGVEGSFRKLTID